MINVSITTPTGEIFNKDLTPPEFLKFHTDYCHSRPVYSWLEATCIPIRTDNLADFCEDVFYPTVMNHALKAQNIAVRILATLAALILDTLTLPIRLFTCAFRLFDNPQKEDHPLYQYLIRENSTFSNTPSDFVDVVFMARHDQPTTPDPSNVQLEAVHQRVRFIDAVGYDDTKPRLTHFHKISGAPNAQIGIPTNPYDCRVATAR